MSTEDTVLAAIKPYISLVPLRSIHIGRDPLTNQARGVCYLELRSVVDSMFLFQALALNPPVIDGRRGKDVFEIKSLRSKSDKKLVYPSPLCGGDYLSSAIPINRVHSLLSRISSQKKQN